MKFLIASDIHGSAFYCRKLMEAYEKEKADRLILLGDILYHGPRNDLPAEYAPKETAALLNTLSDRIYAVRGNCEAEADQMLLDFPVHAEYILLPLGEKMIFATHGHRYNKTNLPPLHRGDILLHGHTHLPARETAGEFYYYNPGSVSIPKENKPHSYMTLEGETFQWKSLEGEVFNP